MHISVVHTLKRSSLPAILFPKRLPEGATSEFAPSSPNTRFSNACMYACIYVCKKCICWMFQGLRSDCVFVYMFRIGMCMKNRFIAGQLKCAQVFLGTRITYFIIPVYIYTHTHILYALLERQLCEHRMLCTHIHVRMSTYRHTNTHTYTHTNTHTYTHTNTHLMSAPEGQTFLACLQAGAVNLRNGRLL
jgi:hypothetical protein